MPSIFSTFDILYYKPFSPFLFFFDFFASVANASVKKVEIFMITKSEGSSRACQSFL